MSEIEAARGTERAPAGGAFAEALCAVDGTHESLAAVEQASTLVGRDGQLTLLLVTSFRFVGDHRSPAIAPTRAERMLDRAVKLAQDTGVRCTVEVDPASPPSEVILDWAFGRELLAIGAPATSWFGGMFLGGVAASAERSFTMPLLIARPPASRPTRRRVLVASDGLEGSDELVGVAARVARAQGADAVLVHASSSEQGSRPHRIERQAQALAQELDGAGEVRVRPGHARTVILESARALEASLVVMGSRRLRGLHAVGSVSRRVVHHADCGVLLLAPEQLQAGAGAP